jgi:ribosomal protein S12 methylthiotransferase
MKNNEKIHVVTLGCSKNTVDSERLMKQLQVNNFKLVNDPSKADTLIINTCGFIEAAREESINTILGAADMKQQGKIKKVFVAGCLSKRYKDELLKEIPEVDVYFGTEDYEGIIKQLGGNLKRDLLGERFLTAPSHSTYLKISEGCDHPCSFCAIPLMRGMHKSKPMEELIREARFLAENNAKELILIAQDTTDYGKDIYGKRVLADLLGKLSEIDGIEWIRLMYAYPSHFPDSVIEVIAHNQKICNYIDIPLQHISDSVLRSMRRGVTSGRTREVVYKLRERVPGIALRTTFITGYPNETEKDFEELCDFVKEVKFDRFGVFTFSVEENTSSFILGDPIPPEEKERRRNILMELQKDISLEKNSSFEGQKLKVLIDRIEGDFYVGRSYRDAPEVDGEVLIQLNGNNLNPGDFCTAEIYDHTEYDLFGRI